MYVDVRKIVENLHLYQNQPTPPHTIKNNN